MKQLFALPFVFLLGCSSGNVDSQNASSNNTAGSTLAVRLNCPSTSTAGQSVTCEAIFEGRANSKQWAVDGNTIGACSNQDTCNISTPSAKSYLVLLLATDENDNFVQSNVATITASSGGTTSGTTGGTTGSTSGSTTGSTTGTTGGGSQLTITCTPSSPSVGQVVTCTASSGLTFISGYWLLDNVQYAACNNQITCSGQAPAGVHEIKAVGITNAGATVTSNTITMNVR